MSTDPNPWSWTKLDRKAACQSWDAVAGFVSWLVKRFDLGDVIPPCWWAHGALVEELTALWAAWWAAYNHDDATADAPIEWMEHLASCRTRLVEWDRMGCAQRGHREGAPASWAFDTAAFSAFVNEDLARRPGTEQLKFEIAASDEHSDKGEHSDKDEPSDNRGDEQAAPDPPDASC